MAYCWHQSRSSMVEHFYRKLEYGISYLPLPLPSTYFDTSGAWGCGFIWSATWCQIKWPPGWLSQNIVCYKRVTVYHSHSSIEAHSGAAAACTPIVITIAVVCAIKSNQAKFPPVSRLLHCLGSQNQTADPYYSF